MKDSCPTQQYIQSIAKAAAGMGEPSCDVLIGGVKVTIHTPFESPLPNEAKPAIRAGRSEVQRGGLAMRVPHDPKQRVIAGILVGWVGTDVQCVYPPVFHSLN